MAPKLRVLLLARAIAFLKAARYTCRAAHVHCSDPMVAEASTQLMVKVFTLNPNPASGKALAKPMEPLVISCDPLDRNAKVTWKKGTDDIPSDDKRISVVENGTSILTIAEPTGEDAGIYHCADSTDVKDIEVFYKVTVTRDDSHSTASSALVEGKEVWVSLKVTGVPAPKLLWIKDGKVLTMPSHVTVEEHKGVPDATLHFNPIKVEDEGTYNCTASGTGTGVGGPDVESIVFKLSVKGKYAALVPFLAICVEVVVLCAAIYFVEKKALAAEQPTIVAEQPAPLAQEADAAPEGEEVVGAQLADPVASP